MADFNQLQDDAATRAAAAEVAPILDVAPVKTITAAAYSATPKDAGCYLRFTNAAAVSFTIPKNLNCPVPIGTEIQMEQAGIGGLTVVAGAGVTINSRGADLILAGQFAVAALKKVAADTWTLTGDL
jgi:hypothetical protein